MTPVLKSAIPAIVLLMTSACGQPDAPRTVSDFCLNDRAIKFDPAPAAGADDPGNTYDTDQTVLDLIEHNAVFHRLCENR